MPGRRQSVQDFKALSEAEVKQLLAFLSSL